MCYKYLLSAHVSINSLIKYSAKVSHVYNITRYKYTIANVKVYIWFSYFER